MQTFGETAAPTTRRGRSGPWAAMVLAAALAGGCAPSVDNNGNLPLAESVAKIEPGKTTRQQVARLLGSPSTQSTFAKDKSWYYVGMRTETFAFFAPEVLEHKVLEVKFDDRGVVTSVKNIDATKAPKIEIVDRTTPTTGRELTIIEQLVGNIGRFNTGETLKGPGGS